eukprot:811158_1
MTFIVLLGSVVHNRINIRNVCRIRRSLRSVHEQNTYELQRYLKLCHNPITIADIMWLSGALLDSSGKLDISSTSGTDCPATYEVTAYVRLFRVLSPLLYLIDLVLVACVYGRKYRFIVRAISSMPMIQQDEADRVNLSDLT